ncbi:hypothetical protein PENTCL1PPCAC_8758, partial [Pristionchus entomophagus]
LFRSYHGRVIDHFYTTNAVEHARANGYTKEGTVGYLGRDGSTESHCSCLRPLFRLYHHRARNHFYTSKATERASAEGFGYKFESIEGYCTSEPACGAYLPLYRFYSASGQNHFYTTSVDEMKKVKSNLKQYKYEGIECYLWQ